MNTSGSDRKSKEWVAAYGQVAGMLPELLSVLLGKPLAPDSQTDIEKSAGDLVKMASEVFPKLPTLEEIQNGVARNQALLNLVECTLRPYLKDIPNDKSVMDYMIGFLDPRRPLPNGSYLLETSYQGYMDTASSIAGEAVRKLPFGASNAYLNSYFSSGEDILASGQTLMTRFPEMHKSLCEKRPFTEEQTAKDIGYYDTLAGLYEKCVALAVGILKLLQGEKVDYPGVRQQTLFANWDYLRKSKYSLLATLDRAMRNALAHKQVIFHVNQGSVKFYDRKLSVEYSYEETREKTKELAASVVCLYDLPGLIQLEQLIGIRDSVKGDISGL